MDASTRCTSRSRSSILLGYKKGRIPRLHPQLSLLHSPTIYPLDRHQVSSLLAMVKGSASTAPSASVSAFYRRGRKSATQPEPSEPSQSPKDSGKRKEKKQKKGKAKAKAKEETPPPEESDSSEEEEEGSTVPPSPKRRRGASARSSPPAAKKARRADTTAAKPNNAVWAKAVRSLDPTAK